MSEKEPSFNLHLTGHDGPRDFEATRDNASLYRHFGALAIYNHAYFYLGQGLSTRIWKHDDSYDSVESYMLKNDFILHDNLRVVDENDIDAYNRMIKRQASDLDHIPEDWK